MKKILYAAAALVLLLASCQSNVGETADETNEANETNETEVIAGREDRAILEDYKNITPYGEHDVKILFMNAGKADSILVQTDGRNYLIDTGTSSSPAMIFPALERMGVETIDAVFFTHTDNDHVGGFETITEKYPVSECYTSAISNEWTTFEDVIGETQWTALDPGAAAELTDGVYFQVLGPIRYNPDENENSLVLRLEVNGKTALFTGDMKYNEEKSLIYNEMPLDCDILKVGYHGREDATSVSFMDAASPEIAVITTDRAEDDDSAHKSIIEGLEDRGAQVYVTDESELGVLVEINASGEIIVSSLETAEEPKNVSITAVSKEDQTVTLINNESEAVVLEGWYILSETGGELFCFPDGASVGAGETVTVACRGYSGEHDYLWEDNRVWNKTKDDRCVLIDNRGNRVDTAESE